MAPELEAELRSSTPWMYEWRLTRDVTAPAQGPELQSVHDTRLVTMSHVVRRALAAAGPRAAVLDLGCNEGWFAHRLLEWGAGRVLGVDVRAINVRRARLVRDHFGISAERCEFVEASVYDLTPERLGTFDVVLVLGLIYHLENPVGALRVARSLAGGLAVVESQLTAQEAPIRVGTGQTGQFDELTANWAALQEPLHEQRDDGNMLSSYGGVLSLIPNRAALVQALEVAGFREVRMLEVPPGLNRQYVDGHRGIAVGWA
ncbi:MAG: class I SAM-dependent methyltransferase [Solirubrobacteraceae bacterium]